MPSATTSSTSSRAATPAAGPPCRRPAPPDELAEWGPPNLVVRSLRELLSLFPADGPVQPLPRLQRCRTRRSFINYERRQGRRPAGWQQRRDQYDSCLPRRANTNEDVIDYAQLNSPAYADLIGIADPDNPGTNLTLCRAVREGDDPRGLGDASPTPRRNGSDGQPGEVRRKCGRDEDGLRRQQRPSIPDQVRHRRKLARRLARVRATSEPPC